MEPPRADPSETSKAESSLQHDPALSAFVEEASRDPDTLGILLHGSRAGGEPREDSDYDLIRVVSAKAYEARRSRGDLHLRVQMGDAAIADVLYQTPARIEPYVTNPGWFTASYLSARVLFDRSGELASMLDRMRSEAGRIAHEKTASAYDGYLNSFVRSMKSARRGDELGRRLHAVESGVALTRALFGLESRWPPYHDRLAPALEDLEQAQGWPDGYLSTALLSLTRDADPSFQQELEGRVERLMSSRGIAHEWGNDLEPLKAFRFDH